MTSISTLALALCPNPPCARLNAELQAVLEEQDAVTAALQEGGKPPEVAGAAEQAPAGSEGGGDGGEAAKAGGVGGGTVKKEGEEGPVGDMGTGLDETLGKSKVREEVGG